MPLMAVAHTTLENPELNQRIIKLYDVSPEFSDGNNALSSIKDMLQKGDTLYLGMFNDKPITAVTVRGTGSTKLLQYIVVHPENRGRGLAQIFIKDVCEQEMAQGVKNFEAGCGVLHKVLNRLNFLKND